MKRSLLNEKEAPRVSLQEPQDSIDKAAQPERLVEGTNTLDADSLQAKMKAAAKEFYTLLIDKMCLRFWREYEGIPRDLFWFKELSPFVQCTPKGVFYLFEGQWIRLTEENLIGARGALKDISKAFKKHGQASWVLPKLQKGGVE